MTPPPPAAWPSPLMNLVPFMVLLLPLAGFTVLALFGDGMKRDKEDKYSGYLACTTALLAFAGAVWTVWHLAHEPGMEQIAEWRRAYDLKPAPESYTPYQPYLGFEWIDVAGLRVPFALLIDPLSAILMLVVTGIGSLIHIYSLGYMAHDDEQPRFFSYLNLFTFFMLLLVMGANLPLMFVGWEGVGLCSYLLIGFWFKKQSASDAGKKAFIVNRIGDAGLILGTILTFYTFGSVDFFEINQAVAQRPAETAFSTITLIGLLLFVGACGKSAQIPLQVWLPDAMEGPTPVSALIHAATMVTAGVYMVVRLGPLYLKAPLAMDVVAGVGGLTAVMAATIALVQTDIKRVLAYSTVSQLGYMFLACGVGAFGVGVFHLYTHAFFKALLFLGSGSVIHAMSGEQDMRQMGGLRSRIPVTFWTFVAGWAAIAGLPFLSGAVSKEEILASAWHAERHGLFWVGLITAGLTAFYMSRLLFLTFFGRFRGSHEAEHHLHESPWSMLGPLVILAVGAIAAGLVDIPHIVRPTLRLEQPEESHVAGLRLMLLSRSMHVPEWLLLPEVHGLLLLASFVAVVGIVVAGYFYLVYRELPARIGVALRPLATALEHKWFFDDVYNWFAARVVVDGSRSLLWQRFDAGFIDGLVNGAGAVTSGIAAASRYAQTGLARGYALLILGGAVALLGYLVWM